MILATTFASALALAQGQTFDPKSLIKGPELMPTCAGCAGEARSLADGQVASQWNLNFRKLAISDDAASDRVTLDYRVTPRFTVGMEWHPRVKETAPRFTWFISPETARHPGVVVGISNDRLSIPEGHATFLTFSKHLPGNLSRVAPFVSVKHLSVDNGVSFPFGANVVVVRGLTLQGLYDGNYTHLILTGMVKNTNLNLMLARMEHPGVAVTVKF